MNEKYWRILIKLLCTNLESHGELFDVYFVNVSSLVLENIDLCDSYSYFCYTYIRPFHDEILTAIFILFSTWLYNYMYIIESLCSLFLLRNQLKWLYSDKQYQRTAPLNYI